jgi:hypothetical protein
MCGIKPLLSTLQSCAYVRAQPEVICKGKALARGASVCYMNSLKRLGKSPRVWQNLHFEGKGTCVDLLGSNKGPKSRFDSLI